MARGKPPVRASDSRIWMLPCGPSPVVIPELLSCAALSGDPDWGLGDLTREECPAETYGDFVVYDEIPGARDNPTLGIKMRYARDLAPLLEFARSTGRADIQLLIGCKGNDVNEYAAPWYKILTLTNARPTKWSAEKISTMDRAGNGSANEMIDLAGEEFYEIVRLGFQQLAATTVVRELKGVDICNSTEDCEDVLCPDPCTTIVAVQVGADPDIPAVIFSSDKGVTWASEDVTTMTFAQVPSDILCAGRYVLVFDATGNSYHYTTLANLLAGAPVWVEVITGFVATKTPNRAIKIGGSVYIAANGGYVYKLAGVGSAVTVLTAGDITTQHLAGISALDSKNIVAVGASNAVIVTDDGSTFSLVVGPAVGVALTAVKMLTTQAWLVSTATGLFGTVNAGASWFSIGLPVAMTAITDIQNVGGVIYLSGVSGGSGVILRNTAGGTDEKSAWYVLPEGVGGIATNQRVNRLAVCPGNHNLVYGAGLGAVADGFLTRALP